MLSPFCGEEVVSEYAILITFHYVSCQLFTSVFGVGPKTAEKWYRRGLRSFNEILTDQSIHLNKMQQTGMAPYHKS